MTSNAKKKNILIWMCFSLFVCYLPWYNFSSMLDQITNELALSSSEIGQILAGFQLGYVITVIFSGWLGDKLGTKRVILMASFLTGVFAVLTPLFSVDLFTLMLFRIATGCASGAIYAPGMALLSNWFPPKERGYAVGAYTGALVSSYAVSYLTGGYLVTSVGWRMGMLITALPSFAGVVAVNFFVDTKSPQKDIATFVSSLTLHFSFAALKAQLLRVKRALRKMKWGFLAILAYLGHMWELYTFWGWIGVFLTAHLYTHGWGRGTASTTAGIVTAGVLFLGAFSSYYLSKWSDQKGRGNTILLCSIASLAGELSLALLFEGYTLPLLVLACWTGFWIVADSAIYKTALTEFVPQEIKTTALGIQSALGFALTVPSNYLFGYLLELVNPTSSPIEATTWVLPFFILFVGGLCAPLFSLILREYEEAKK